jgi:hypothetical protein
MKLIRLVSLAFSLLFIPSVLAGGQTATSGAVAGLAVDFQGGRLPGAAVQLLNTATNSKTSVETNSTGSYSSPTVVSGTYIRPLTSSCGNTVGSRGNP